ncbi:MAG: hypothetical protein E7335_06600 [Clostridiales bacterium]|nr:hypothetical protein [Clostridiales bacterium]
MISNKAPFEVYFCDADLCETLVGPFEEKVAYGVTYYEAKHNGLFISVLCRDDGEWYVKSINFAKAPITGFLCVRFPWHGPDHGYTLIPGIYYNGNCLGETNDIPKLKMPEKPVFQSSMSATTTPAVFCYDGGDTGIAYSLSPMSNAGWNGCTLNGADKTVSFYAPAREDNRYALSCFRGDSRPPYTWQRNAVITMHIYRKEFKANCVSDIFTRLFENERQVPHYSHENEPRFSEEEAASLVFDWVYNKHCLRSSKGTPILANAFDTLDENGNPILRSFDWHNMIGWCSGTMTAYPLLKRGGKCREYAIDYIDYISQNGNSPSGVKYPIEDETGWLTPEHPNDALGYKHARFYGDYLYYLGRSIALEKENGVQHPAWEADFLHGINILLDLWQRKNDFGLYWDREGEKVEIIRPNTGAGSYCLLALSEAAKHYPEREDIKKCIYEAAAVYTARCVDTGRCNAGPMDIIEADDSESTAALTNALVNIYKLYKEEKHLDAAVRAGRMFASWCTSYVQPFPGGSMLEGRNLCGGVLANVQNRHIGPGICTNSALFLHDLYEFTGDAKWERLYRNVKAAAINCVTAYDGEIYGLFFGDPFYKGMLTEQINMTDCLGEPGETWRVSASWPATAVILGWADTPRA